MMKKKKSIQHTMHWILHFHTSPVLIRDWTPLYHHHKVFILNFLPKEKSTKSLHILFQLFWKIKTSKSLDKKIANKTAMIPSHIMKVKLHIQSKQKQLLHQKDLQYHKATQSINYILSNHLINTLTTFITKIIFKQIPTFLKKVQVLHEREPY